MVGILNLNLGNIKSVYNMLMYLGCDAKIVENIKELEKIKKLIIPGIGSFDEACKNIFYFKDLLDYKILEEKITVLGICIGMHIFCKESEEGSLKGLGYFDIKVKKFNTSKVPHIGFKWIGNKKYYFIHSYYVPVNKFTTEIVEYDNIRFSAIIKKDNIMGVQFHPEKSHKYGIEFFKEFIGV